MRTAESVGYLASSLVFATFYMKTMTPMRAVAIASNVAFICYGYLGEMIPILVLHAILLPLNIWRFLQICPLLNDARPAAKGDLSLGRLLPDTAFRKFAAGEVIFRKGEPARELLLITAGRVQLTELQVEAGPGSTIGEIGEALPRNVRTATAVALTNVDALAIAEERIIALHNVESELGLYLVRPTAR